MPTKSLDCFFSFYFRLFLLFYSLPSIMLLGPFWCIGVSYFLSYVPDKFNQNKNNFDHVSLSTITFVSLFFLLAVTRGMPIFTCSLQSKFLHLPETKLSEHIYSCYYHSRTHRYPPEKSSVVFSLIYDTINATILTCFSVRGWLSILRRPFWEPRYWEMQAKFFGSFVTIEAF